MKLKVFAGAALLTSASAAAATGVSGTVHIAPSHPGPQRIGDSGSAPMQKAPILVLDVRRRVVARAVTGVDGSFSVTLPPGEYSVEVDMRAALLQRCSSVYASVQEGKTAAVKLECDSGMR